MRNVCELWVVLVDTRFHHKKRFISKYLKLLNYLLFSTFCHPDTVSYQFFDENQAGKVFFSLPPYYVNGNLTGEGYEQH